MCEHSLSKRRNTNSHRIKLPMHMPMWLLWLSLPDLHQPMSEQPMFERRIMCKQQLQQLYLHMPVWIFRNKLPDLYKSMSEQSMLERRHMRRQWLQLLHM